MKLRLLDAGDLRVIVRGRAGDWRVVCGWPILGPAARCGNNTRDTRKTLTIENPVCIMLIF
jgi:hypothetical protein